MAVNGEDLFRVSRADFLAGELLAPTKSEWVDGVAYGQARAARAHGRAATRIVALLAGTCAERAWLLVGSDLLVETATGALYYPDVVVSCAPSDDDRIEHNPCFIAEVLSPSTSRIDRHEKRAAYCATGSMQDYWIVDVDAKVIEAWTRTDDGWVGGHRMSADLVAVQCLGAEFQVVDVVGC